MRALVVLALFAMPALAEPKLDPTTALNSLMQAAKTMDVELPQSCLEAIAARVIAFGYSQGAVTNRGGVLIRDLFGVDTWVCK